MSKKYGAVLASLFFLITLVFRSSSLFYVFLLFIIYCYIVPRNCGKVFCSDCADRDMPLPHQNLFQPVRVCNMCFDSLRGGNEDTETAFGVIQEHSDLITHTSHQRGRAFSLTNLNTGPCICQCCKLKRPTKFKAVTAGST